MSDVVTRDFRLHIDGGGAKKLPVRCEGYVEDGSFHCEAVWIDFDFGSPQVRQPQAYDIIENLKPRVIAALEAAAEDQMGEDL